MPTLLPLIQYLFLILLRFGRYIISFLFSFFFFLLSSDCIMNIVMEAELI